MGRSEFEPRIDGLEGDPEKGKEKAGQICQACHGLDGNGIPGQPVWPKIAGQHPRYIYKQLNNFKNSVCVFARLSTVIGLKTKIRHNWLNMAHRFEKPRTIIVSTTPRLARSLEARC